MVELLYTHMRHTGTAFYIGRNSRERRKYIYVSALEKRMKVKLRYKRILIYIIINAIVWGLIWKTHELMLLSLGIFFAVAPLFEDISCYGGIEETDKHYYLYGLFKIREISKENIEINYMSRVWGRGFLSVIINGKSYYIATVKKAKKNLRDFLHMCKNIDGKERAEIEKQLNGIE